MHMRKLVEIEGLPVVNARREIILNITAGDCKTARRKSPSGCAAARALSREFGEGNVRVHLSRAYVKRTAKAWTRYLTPQALRREAIALDRGGTFAPGEYILAAPYTRAKHATGKRQGGADPIQKKNTKKQRQPHITVDVRPEPTGA